MIHELNSNQTQVRIFEGRDNFDRPIWSDWMPLNNDGNSYKDPYTKTIVYLDE